MPGSWDNYKPIVPWTRRVKCLNCGRPVMDEGPYPKSPAGWMHWGAWNGIRCPDGLTTAEQGADFTEREYWAYVNEQNAKGPVNGRGSWTNPA